MRQQKILTGILIIAGIVLVGVIAFAVVRGRPWTTDRLEQGHRTDEHTHNDHHNGADDDDHQHRADANSPHSHGNSGQAGSEPSHHQVSGHIQDGVRVVRVAARQFEFDPAHCRHLRDSGIQFSGRECEDVT